MEQPPEYHNMDMSQSEKMPYSAHFEKEILGMLLRDVNVLQQCGKMNASWFFEPVHALIFNAIVLGEKKGFTAVIDFVSQELVSEKIFISAGGEKYLKDLAWDMTITTPKDCASILYALNIKRAMMSVGEELIYSAKNDKLSDLNARVTKCESDLYNLSASDNQSEFVSINKSVKDIITNLDVARKDIHYMAGLPSGFSSLDYILKGFKNSELIILAARPAMGKTSLATSIAYNVADYCKQSEEGGVAFFSLEMSLEQISIRLMTAHEPTSNSQMLKTGRTGEASQISDIFFQKIKDNMAQLQSMPLYIDETPAISISNIRTKAKRMKNKHNISLIVVDYLQLVKGSDRYRGNRVQEVSEITQGLKNIAKELNIPVIALSQLSRSVESRENNRPQLSDLRESGSIEQDADVVMMLYREAYYAWKDKPQQPPYDEPDDPRQFLIWQAATKKYEDWEAEYARVEHLAEVIVAKNRNGASGDAKLFFDGKRTVFKDLQEF